MADADPLNRRVVEQMLVGVATRQYARSLEPLPPAMASRGTSKSAVSRRFVAKTAAQLDAWRSTGPLQDLRRKIYVKAKAEPSWRFWGLYVHVCKQETLRAAYALARI